jgi:hypothetical protein
MALDVKAIVADYKRVKASSGGRGANKEDFVVLTGNPDGNQMRLVPFKDSEGVEKLYVHTRTHFLGEGRGAVACRSITGEPCPVCEYQAAAKARKIKVVADQLYPRDRVYYNVIVPGQGGKGELKILEVGKQIHLAILALFANEDYGDIADLKTGNNIKIFKEGSMRETKYRVEPRPKKTPCPAFDGSPRDLTSFAAVPTYEEAEATLHAVFAPFENEERVPGDEPVARGKTATEFNPDAGYKDSPDSITSVTEEEQPESDDWKEEVFGSPEKPQPAKAAKPAPPAKPKPSPKPSPVRKR